MEVGRGVLLQWQIQEGVVAAWVEVIFLVVYILGTHAQYIHP